MQYRTSGEVPRSQSCPCIPHGMCRGLREWRAICLPVCAKDTAVCGPGHPGLPVGSQPSEPFPLPRLRHITRWPGRWCAAGGHQPQSQAASTPPSSLRPHSTGYWSPSFSEEKPMKTVERCFRFKINSSPLSFWLSVNVNFWTGKTEMVYW